VIESAPSAAGVADQDWFARAEALERTNPKAAIEAYGKAIAAAPERLDARVNLGRLLHETGRHQEAERVYRDAVKACGRDPLLLFNLGVLLGDLDRKREAIEAYEAALRGDPAMADSHYNLGLLYEKLGKAKQAIRHMSEYRRLMQIHGD
jgi:tetratricopeptide (TPR) repeat protein